MQKKYNFNEIWNECLNFNIEQKPEEYKNLLDFLNDNSKKRFALEIGSNYGGTAAGLCNLFENVITIDIKHHPNFDILKNKHNSYNYIISDSKVDTTIEYLKTLNVKFDFIFIDGDHSYDGVKSDFFRYKQFLNDDGYIAFHDIVESEENKNNNIFVSNFWNEIKNEYNETWEFINKNKNFEYKTDNLFHNIMQNQKYETWGGIGLIKNIKLTIFSHNYLTNNWKSIIENQFQMITNYGLYKRVDELNYGVFSENDSDYHLFLSLIKKYDTDLKINITRFSKNNFEYPSLINLQNYCNYNKNGIVFYFHSKGTSKENETESLKSHRECLEYFNLEKWRICFDHVKKNNYDIAGSLYITFFKNSIREYRNYYSGNFWWARCEYINTLPNLLYISNLIYHDQSDYRMETELWIGKSNHRWLSLYSENISDHLTHIFYKKNYRIFD